MGQVVLLGNNLLARLTMLARDAPARRWEPKALRHRIYLFLDGCTHSPPRTTPTVGQVDSCEHDHRPAPLERKTS